MKGGILGVCFIIGTGQREDYTMGMLESCMLLLVSYLVFLIMLMYASIIISAKKTEKWNLQDKHEMVLPVKSILFMTEFQRMASVICSYISRNRWAQMRRY